MFSETINNILGEVLWHSITVDSTIASISGAHCNEISRVLAAHGKDFDNSETPIRILEVAAYAHTTGYMLANKFNTEVTLSDISIDTLALGRDIAIESNLDNDKVTRIASDFHDLPFTDNYFDLVYIASALHHTWSWQKVLQELMRTVKLGGLLFLENEPCAREFCFYKFRTNRREQFREIEKTLDQEGLLRIIAEPFLGSRQEELFGMVENQTMQLSEMLGILRQVGSIEELSLNPESCMNALENIVFDHREHDIETVKQLIIKRISRGIEVAAKSLSEIDLKMGYSLPASVEIESMAGRIAKSITGISKNSPLDSELVRVAISSIFGASVTMVIKKHSGTEFPEAEKSLKYDWGERSSVKIGYPPEVQKVLEATVDLLPDIQRSSAARIAASFPTDQWTTYTDEKGLKCLFPSSIATIQCLDSTGKKKFLIMLRIYALFDGEPFGVVLKSASSEIGKLEIFQSDTYLLRAVIESSESALEFSLEISYLNAEFRVSKKPIVLNVSAARVCAL
jgi:ubiquinone/menaquinone biosynthesis C-methylase UbiE